MANSLLHSLKTVSINNLIFCIILIPNMHIHFELFKFYITQAVKFFMLYMSYHFLYELKYLPSILTVFASGLCDIFAKVIEMPLLIKYAYVKPLAFEWSIVFADDVYEYVSIFIYRFSWGMWMLIQSVRYEKNFRAHWIILIIFLTKLYVSL